MYLSSSSLFGGRFMVLLLGVSPFGSTPSLVAMPSIFRPCQALDFVTDRGESRRLALALPPVSFSRAKTLKTRPLSLESFETFFRLAIFGHFWRVRRVGRSAGERQLLTLVPDSTNPNTHPKHSPKTLTHSTTSLHYLTPLPHSTTSLHSPKSLTQITHPNHLPISLTHFTYPFHLPKTLIDEY